MKFVGVHRIQNFAIQPDPVYLNAAGSGSKPDPDTLDPAGSPSDLDPPNSPDIWPDPDLLFNTLIYIAPACRMTSDLDPVHP